MSKSIPSFSIFKEKEPKLLEEPQSSWFGGVFSRRKEPQFQE